MVQTKGKRHFFTLYTYSINYLCWNFRRRKSAHRKTNNVFFFRQNEHNLAEKKSSAKCIFVLYQWVLDRNGTFRWRLQDYILLNILKWINLGKPVDNIFSLAWKPTKITPDKYHDILIHTHFFPAWNPTRGLHWTSRLCRRKLWYSCLCELESTLKSITRV
jgi:hypothetical protein